MVLIPLHLSDMMRSSVTTGCTLTGWYKTEIPESEAQPFPLQGSTRGNSCCCSQLKLQQLPKLNQNQQNFIKANREIHVQQRLKTVLMFLTILLKLMN